MNEVTFHFNLARSKIGEQVVQQVNLEKSLNDRVDRNILIDRKKR